MRRRQALNAAALAAAAATVWSAASAQSQNSEAGPGRIKALACAVCHGPLGISVTPDAPNLAGQPVIYLATQLRAYRSGKRAHEVMGVLAKPLSDDDITQLAAWFSSIRIEAHAPR